MSMTEKLNMSFNTKTVAALTGLTRHQIGSWDRARVVKPSLPGAAGGGRGRLYSFSDLVQLKAAMMLAEKGVSLQTTRTVVQYLKKHFPDRDAPVTGLQFITDRETVFVLTNDTATILDTLAKGRMVFVLALGKIIEDLKCEVDDVCRERAYKVRVEKKAYEVVLHPDAEEGGFCVACPTLPGCDSQGDTVDEALEMIKDAIKGHLAVAAKQNKKPVVA
jgi:predicted RNase H-like HicB family nuclease